MTASGFVLTSATNESLEELQVANARAQGWSWQQIADALAVSRQAVHKKYRRSAF